VDEAAAHARDGDFSTAWEVYSSALGEDMGAVVKEKINENSWPAALVGLFAGTVLSF
jgi:hypothetical protein